MSGVQIIEIDEDGQDQRLDRWFRTRFAHITQGRIEKMCRKGEIRLDGGRVKASTRLETGQSIRVPPMPESSAPVRSHQPEVSKADAEFIRDCVIYRDDHIIALNKPPGLAVQGGTKQSRHVDGMSDALRFGLDARPKLVHRLDKDTSGVFILARTGRAASGLARAFQSRKTRKLYWAVVAGVPSPKMGTIRYGLVKQAGHGPHGAGEKMVCVHPDQIDQIPDARRATTDYRVLESAAQRASWVALAPITGRTHQLRAHMAEIGAPIVGDGKYGNNTQTNEGDGWGAQLGGDISRKLHLHARTIRLTHPVSGANLEITAPLPEHMKNTWEIMGWDSSEVPEDPFSDEFL